jgi:signal transduction histidine kinase/ligand-binding sensor domain-containing protein
MNKKTQIVFLLGLLSVPLFSQNQEILRSQDTEMRRQVTFDPAFEEFELPAGLLGNSIQGIIQDSVGYMWFASQAGLHRYDGRDFMTFNTDPGNPNTINSDYIEDIYLDSEGIIWLSHWLGGGLTSYDPDNGIFKRYEHHPDDQESILPNETGEIIEDVDGYIWVGGRVGISRLDKETGKFRRFYSDPDDHSSLSNGEVRGLYVDSENTLWIATGMPWIVDGLGGLNKYIPETESFERFVHDPDNPASITSNKVRALFEDSRGNFWVGTGGDGLHKLDKKTGQFTHYPGGSENTTNITAPTLKVPDPIILPEHSHITSIYEDKSRRLWITAVGGGLNVYDPAIGATFHFEKSEEEHMLTTNFIWQTFQSDDGTIWIATGGDGQKVYKIKEDKLLFPFFDTRDFTQDTVSIAHGIIKDKDGNVWIGQTQNQLTDYQLATLWRVDRSSQKVDRIYFGGLHEDSLGFNGFIGSISKDEAGNLWVGTSDGYFFGTPEKADFKIFRPDFALDDFGIPPVLSSRGGDIWVANWNSGIFRYDPETGEYEIFEHDPKDPESLSGPVVMSIFEDSKGDIWVGGGTPWYDPTLPLFLDRYDPVKKSFEHFISENIPIGVISDMTEDHGGNIWFIDFNENIFKINPQNKALRKFTPYNSLLPGGNLHSISTSPDGNLWISSNQSIIELDPVWETMSIYNELHGVKPAYDFWNGGSIAEDGELFFARRGGFHAFYPDRFLSEIKENLPDLRITGFRLLDDYISSGMNASGSVSVLDKPIWKTSLIELESYQNIFSFSVACFDFYEPEANQIQFMLEGYDRGWRQDVRNGETPYYVNVNPGEYTFRLRGANSLGVWNKEGISLKLIVHPPWFMTLWAYVLYGFVLVGGVFAVDRLQRKRLLSREREKTQQRELEQAREIEKAYRELKATQTQLIHSEKMASLGELTAGIAHEIQNPLNFVNNFSELSIDLIAEMDEEIASGNYEEVKAINQDIKSNLEKINFHGKRASSIVNGMLAHSRTGSGQKELTDINVLAEEYVRLSYHGLRAKEKSFNADFKLELNEHLPKVNLIGQEFGRVLLNLFNNAFYAVSEKARKGIPDYKPQVVVKTIKQNGQVEIRVKDNGDGIPDNIVNKIFQPFFTTKPAGQGTGLGLSLSYDIITKGHDGTLEVDTVAGLGTEFIIKLPVV